jgi:hypothetical protein
MGIGAIGGKVEEGSLASRFPSEAEEPHADSLSVTENDFHLSRRNHERMWEEWGNNIQLWADVGRIADRTVGNIMSSHRGSSSFDKVSLEPTIIPWSTVASAWSSHESNHDVRKRWLKEASPSRETAEEDEIEDTSKNVDEVVERLKNDDQLNFHEERLLSCIVNSGRLFQLGVSDCSLNWLDLQLRCQLHLIKSIFLLIPLIQCGQLFHYPCCIPELSRKVSSRNTV